MLDREAERRAALVDDDMVRFAEILADDLIHVHSTGKVDDKAGLIDHAGRFLRFRSVERGPLVIRFLGPDAAVMTGPMTNRVGRRGEDELVEVHAFVTQVWARRDGRWLLVSFHAGRQPDR